MKSFTNDTHFANDTPLSARFPTSVRDLDSIEEHNETPTIFVRRKRRKERKDRLRKFTLADSAPRGVHLFRVTRHSWDVLEHLALRQESFLANAQNAYPERSKETYSTFIRLLWEAQDCLLKAVKYPVEGFASELSLEVKILLRQTHSCLKAAYKLEAAVAEAAQYREGGLYAEAENTAELVAEADDLSLSYRASAEAYSEFVNPEMAAILSEVASAVERSEDDPTRQQSQ